MNRTLIDTDILSYYFKGNQIVVKNFENYLQDFDLIEISIITYYEIIGGLMAKNALMQLNVFQDFVDQNIVVPMTENSAKISAELYSTLRQQGNTVDDIDLLIAGVAIDNDLTLVTNNENHFNRIPGLRVENWSKHML
ncbi:MAG: type II toxin-antitoxin system VapC family toxin [Salinivirgaceae bacterium]|jgi:tRNA(fMet)-specific endonuclease VapC|nr:type II toxin-antitoxin system VapC family toxin [Salinivirgaceae bacterium]